MESYPIDVSVQYPGCELVLDKGVIPQVAAPFCSAIMAVVVALEEAKGFECVVFEERSDDRVERGDEVVKGTAAVATAAAKETMVVSTGRERVGELVAAPFAGVQVTWRCAESKE